MLESKIEFELHGSIQQGDILRQPIVDARKEAFQVGIQIHSSTLKI